MSDIDLDDPFGIPAEVANPQKAPRAEAAVQHSESSARAKASSMAYGGKQTKVEEFPQVDFPQWGSLGSDLLEYVPSDEEELNSQGIDISDVAALNREILRSRSRLFKVQKVLVAAQREAAETKFEHRRKRNRYLIGLSGGTDKSREAMADIATEEEYGKMVVAEQVAIDLLSQSRAVKAELDSLANLSHNIRAQMNIR